MPKSLSSTSGKTVVATSENVQVYDSESKKVCQQDNLGYAPTVAAIDPAGNTVFVGGEVRNATKINKGVRKETIAHTIFFFFCTVDTFIG